MKILLIDDDDALLTVFETALAKDGYKVLKAYDGKSGIEKAKAESPDLVLVDQILPDMKGNDVLKILKEDSRMQNVPIAILSNFGQQELIHEAINLGALDYILKYQISPDDLRNKVRQLTGGAHAAANTG